MTAKDKKFNQVMSVFTKIQDDIKVEVEKLIQAGLLTADMMDFDYNGDMIELEVAHTVVYPDGTKGEISKIYYLDFNLVVSENQ